MEGRQRRKMTWGDASLSKPSPLWNLIVQKGFSQTSSVSASFSTQWSKSQESFGRSRYLLSSWLRDGSRYQIRWIFRKVQCKYWQHFVDAEDNNQNMLEISKTWSSTGCWALQCWWHQRTPSARGGRGGTSSCHAPAKVWCCQTFCKWPWNKSTRFKNFAIPWLPTGRSRGHSEQEKCAFLK